jgi:hypothetical protein
MVAPKPVTFAQVKAEIRADQNNNSRYGRFLDKLVLDYDNRGKIAAWDIWYFSDNTEFCLEAAKHYRAELDKLITAHKLLHAEKEEAIGKYSATALRRTLGSELFYLYAVLDSFSQEANLLYDLNVPRDDVSLGRVAKALALQGRRCRLSAHIQQFQSKPGAKVLLDYRNAIAHGHVFPLVGSYGSLRLKRKPKTNMFSFSDADMDVEAFIAASYSIVHEFICKGWACFSVDELS